MVAAFLPRVDALLKHRNNAYPPLAVDFLEMVLASFGDSIRHGLASRDFSIGVDVAAEQRFDRCTKCKNALLQVFSAEGVTILHNFSPAGNIIFS